MPNRVNDVLQILTLFCLISLHMSTGQIDIQKMYWLGTKDLAVVEIDEILQKDVLLNNVTVNQEEDEYSNLEIIQAKDFTNIQLNEHSKLPPIDIKKIIYTNDRGKYLTFSYEDSEEKTFILIILFETPETFTFRIMQMASAHFQCGEFEYTDDKIFMPCINKLDRLLHICETNYQNNDLSVCTIYPFRIAIPIGVSIEDLVLRIQMYQNLNGFYFKMVNLTIEEDVLDNKMGIHPSEVDPNNPKPDEPINPNGDGYDFRNHFFFLQPGQNMVYTLPIDNLQIDQLYMIASNNYLKERKFLMSGRSGSNLDLLTFSVNRGVLDIDTMGKGFLRGGIEFYEVSANKILILDIDKFNSTLLISVFDLTKLTEKNLVIEKQIELLESDNKHDMIYLQTRNTRFTVENYIVDMKTGRLFKSDFLPFCPNCSNTIMHMEQQYFLVSLEHGTKHKVDFKVAKLNNQDQIYFGLRDKEHENFSASLTKRDINNQMVQTANFQIFSNKMLTIDYNIAFLENDFFYYRPRSSQIQGRTFVGFSYFISIFQNNLQTDEHDPSMLWFNAIKFQMTTKAKAAFQKTRVMHVWSATRVYFLLKSSMVATWKNFKAPSENVEYINSFKKYRLSMKIFEPEDKAAEIEYMNWNQEFLLILKNKTKLYAFPFGAMEKRSEIPVQRLPMTAGMECMFMELLMMCYLKKVELKAQGRRFTPSAQKRMSLYEGKIFYEFFVKTNHLHVAELTSFLPDLNYLVHGLAFYPSRFELYRFESFIPSQKIIVKLSSSDKNYASKDTIEFIKPEWYPYVTFKEIAYRSFIVIYSRPYKLKIWLQIGSAVYQYPTEGYIQDFKQLKKVKVLYRGGIFALVYETTTGQTRVAIYLLAASPMRRLIRDFKIYTKLCPEHDSFFEIAYFKRKVYFTYICTSKQVYKVWISYFFFGPSLQITPERNFYGINIGSVEKTFTFTKSNYYKNISFVSQPLVFKEMTSKTQVLNLESTGLLALKGDVVDVQLAEPHKFVKLNQRVTLENTEYYQHEKPFDTNEKLSINRAQNGEILIVTNEFLISGHQKQYNNFVYGCKFLPFDLNDFFIQDIETLYLCKDKSGSNLVITDHHTFQVRFPSFDHELVSPNLIFKQDYMFLIHIAKGINGAIIEKYLFLNKDLKNLIFISSFMVPSSFKPNVNELSQIYAMYVNQEDKIYIIFDSMQSKGFDIMGYRVREDFFSKDDFQLLIPQIPGDNFYFI